jgi:hypothetical protein
MDRRRGESEALLGEEFEELGVEMKISKKRTKKKLFLEHLMDENVNRTRRRKFEMK